MPPAKKRDGESGGDGNTEPTPQEAQHAAEEVEQQARAEAERQAHAAGVSLSDDELDRIGKTAAQEVHRLFEREGAFKQSEPPPPPPPQPPGDHHQEDEPPHQPPKGAKGIAHRLIGGY